MLVKIHDKELELSPDDVRSVIEQANGRKKPKIEALQSMPRLCFTGSQVCVTRALTCYGIPLRSHQGAWWERCIQKGLQNMIADGVEYAVTFDYDSLFTLNDFAMMLHCFMSNPHIDALSCTQPKRCEGFSFGMPDREDSNVEVVRDEGGNEKGILIKKMTVPTRYLSAHFGMTFFRLNRLKDIPKPWLINVPATNGEWEGEGAIDADMYFWRKWREHGRNLYVIPCVSIGHMEVVSARINLNSKGSPCEYNYATDWENKNVKLDITK